MDDELKQQIVDKAERIKDCIKGHCYSLASLYVDELLAAVQSLPEPEQRDDELRSWKRFAAYCRSCAMSGENDPHTFEQFKAEQDRSRFAESEAQLG
jgi:hypothetical protein